MSFSRLTKIRNTYGALKTIYKKIPLENIHIRKKIFCAFALPHFIWLFATWFYYTEKQKQEIEHLYCAGIRIVYNLGRWNDHVTLVLAQDKSLLDYLFDYWKKFIKHLNESPEGNEYREIWEAYMIINSTDKNFYKSMGLRRNNFFMNRLVQKAQYTNLDIFSFFNTHECQKDYFKTTHSDAICFVQKYIVTR